jgi:hypothetical protein
VRRARTGHHPAAPLRAGSQRARFERAFLLCCVPVARARPSSLPTFFLPNAERRTPMSLLAIPELGSRGHGVFPQYTVKRIRRTLGPAPRHRSLAAPRAVLGPAARSLLLPAGLSRRLADALPFVWRICRFRCPHPLPASIGCPQKAFACSVTRTWTRLPAVLPQPEPPFVIRNFAAGHWPRALVCVPRTCARANAL